MEWLPGGRHGAGTTSETSQTAPQSLYLCRLRRGGILLLGLSLRFHDVQRLYAGKPLGHDLQQHHLDLS